MKPKEKPRKNRQFPCGRPGPGQKEKIGGHPRADGHQQPRDRSRGLSILRSIDFAHGRLQSMADEDSYRTMSLVRDAAVKALMDAPTIFDKVEGIGETMAYAAKAWKIGRSGRAAQQG